MKNLPAGLRKWLQDNHLSLIILFIVGFTFWAFSSVRGQEKVLLATHSSLCLNKDFIQGTGCTEGFPVEYPVLIYFNPDKGVLKVSNPKLELYGLEKVITLDPWTSWKTTTISGESIIIVYSEEEGMFWMFITLKLAGMTTGYYGNVLN